jgi:hypothetical protein
MQATPELETQAITPAHRRMAAEYVCSLPCARRRLTMDRYSILQPILVHELKAAPRLKYSPAHFCLPRPLIKNCSQTSPTPAGIPTFSPRRRRVQRRDLIFRTPFGQSRRPTFQKVGACFPSRLRGGGRGENFPNQLLALRTLESAKPAYSGTRVSPVCSCSESHGRDARATTASFRS